MPSNKQPLHHFICQNFVRLRSSRSELFFGKVRPEVIPDFEIHPVNLDEKSSGRHPVVFAVGFGLANLRDHLLQLPYSLLAGLKFLIVIDHNITTSTMPRLFPSRLICQ